MCLSNITAGNDHSHVIGFVTESILLCLIKNFFPVQKQFYFAEYLFYNTFIAPRKNIINFLAWKKQIYIIKIDLSL